MDIQQKQVLRFALKFCERLDWHMWAAWIARSTKGHDWPTYVVVTLKVFHIKYSILFSITLYSVP